MLKRLILIAALSLSAAPLAAVQPDEMLPDAALEGRARTISQQLRCPVCQGENIDDSNAQISRDLRLLVRERLVAGDSDPEVLDYITARYGEYVLFAPRATGANWVLYLAGPVLLALAALIGALFIRARRPTRSPAAPAPLSPEEQAELDQILRD